VVFEQMGRILEHALSEREQLGNGAWFGHGAMVDARFSA
jgi:hypothetical protein